MNYNNRNLWDLFLQPVTIFGWKNILEQWDNSLVMPQKVQVVVDNLRATSDPDSTHEIPLRHFLDYLNYEEEAIMWFLYEVVTLRWTWGETRLDFVKELLRNHNDCFDLDKTFPDFPGSPRQTQTVREFLQHFLNADEQQYVQIPPVHKNQKTFKTLSEAFEAIRSTKSEKLEKQAPSFDWSAVQKAFEETEEVMPDNQEELIQLQKQNKKLNKQNKKLEKQNNKLIEENDLLCEAVETLQEQSKAEDNNSVEEMSVTYAPFTIQFNRRGGEDDKVMIRKADDDDLYNIVFMDSSANIRHKVRYVSREQVINYVSSSLRLMRYDADPYDNIQIFIPAGPTVLLNPRTTIQIRETIYDCLESAMDNWPVSC